MNYFTIFTQFSHHAVAVRIVVSPVRKRPVLTIQLVHVAWKVPLVIIQMDKGTIHGRHTLQNVLQALSHIMAIPKASPLINNQVYLNIELVAGVVSLEVLNLLNDPRKTHRHVQ